MDEKVLYNQIAEESLIGAALINPKQVRYLDLEANEFYVQRNAWLWQAILDLEVRGYNMDIVTLSEELNKRNQLEPIGGVPYLAKLVSNTTTSLAMDNHAVIIREYAQRRNMLRVAQALAKAAYDSKDLDAAAASAIDTLVTGAKSDGGAIHISKVISEIYVQTNERREDPKDVWGITTGFIDFDRMTGGLHPGEVYYLAGEPGIGKSKLAIQMGINMGKSGEPGSIFSLEMGRKQLMTRSLSSLAEVPTRNIKTGRMTDDEWRRFNRACDAANLYPIYISDQSGITTSKLRSELARLQAQHGIKWAVIDYLLLMGDADGKDETELSSKISKRIKQIAVSLNMCIISVNSVTKEAMGDNATISQKNVRGSSTVVHDADVIGMLTKHKPEPYEIQRDNLRTHWFVKGRELEGLGYFHLVAFDKWPSFGNYQKG